jgi:hypothetical protein
MIGFLIRTGVRMLTLAGVLYFAFFVPIGPYTLAGHLSRIAGTSEAGDLTQALSGAAADAYTALHARVTALRH